jgi:phage repressor protein C with HTH and peptisase S24 domain
MLDTVGQRVKFARKNAGLSIQQLSRKAGIAPTTLYDLERGDQKSTTKLPLIADATGYESAWLQTGQGNKSAEKLPDTQNKDENLASEPTLTIPYYNEVKASAGHGYVPLDEADVTLMRIAKRQLERHGVPSKYAALVQVDGDSMSPTIEHRDTLLVDMADREPRESRIYLVRIEEVLMVKRIQRIPRGVRLLSDNAAYPPIEIMDGEQREDIEMIGRIAIVWRQHSLM